MWLLEKSVYFVIVLYFTIGSREHPLNIVCGIPKKGNSLVEELAAVMKSFTRFTKEHDVISLKYLDIRKNAWKNISKT